MLVRQVAECISCESRIVTRTQIGHKDRQEHSFPCPRCGVSISFAFDLDQEKGEWKSRPPKNAKWVESEEGAVKVLTFSDEIAVPVDLPDIVSPYIATWMRYKDHESYQQDETLRQMFVRHSFEYAERCRVHFERGNWDLFDKESAPPEHEPVSARTRLIALYNLYTAAFGKFTLMPRAKYDRVFQRLRHAKALDGNLVNELCAYYLNSGRLHSLWLEIFSARKSFVNCYNYVQPLLQVHYWRDEHKTIADVKLSDKRFNELRQLYIDCFETLCRLLVLAIGFETIIHYRKLEIPTKKGSLSLGQFEQLPNARIADLFLPSSIRISGMA